MAAAVRATLTALRDERAASGADRVPAVLGSETPVQAYPPAALLAELDARAAVFVRARRGQSCLQACSELRCCSHSLMPDLLDVLLLVH